MGNNINKKTEKLPQAYSFLGKGQVICQNNISQNNRVVQRKYIEIQTVVKKNEFQLYEKSYKKILNQKNNMFLPLKESFNREQQGMICSDNRICRLKYEFVNLENTLEAQFNRRQSQNLMHEKTRDVRKNKQNKQIQTNNQQNCQAYFDQLELLHFLKAMISTTDFLCKQFIKSSNYKFSEILIQSSTFDLQIANYLTWPTFQSVYQKYLADPNKIRVNSSDLEYLAPQEWFYLKRNTEIKPCNKSSQIFIIGKNILKLMCLSSLQDLYDKNYFNSKVKIEPHKIQLAKGQKRDPPEEYFNQIKHFFNQLAIQCHLKEAYTRYDKQLVDLIKEMLNTNYYQRPITNQIIERIKKIQQKSEPSIYEKLIPTMNSFRQSNNDEPQQNRNTLNNYFRKTHKNNKSQIVRIGNNNSSRSNKYQKIKMQTQRKQELGCFPFDIKAEMVTSEYVSFKQSARQSNFM